MIPFDYVAEDGSEELQDIWLRYLLAALFILATFPLWYLAAAADRDHGLGPLWSSLSLFATWSISLQCWRLSRRLGSIALVVGLMIAVSITTRVVQAGPVGLGFGPVAMIATILLGPWWGLGAALLSSGFITLAGPPDSATVSFLMIALDWGSFVLAWIFWQPVHSVLARAWQSCAQSVTIAEQLRDHQVELSRVNRSLNEAYTRLEQLSRDLDCARRHAEENRRRKVEFATCISHELRTPLNLIIGFSEMMLMGPRARAIARALDTYRGDVEAIYRNACHLSSLIDDVLDLSQVDAHRMGLKREPVSLAQVVDEAVTAVTVMFQDKGLRLTTDLSGVPVILNIDRVRIRQVLINLLSNAARFTVSGGVTIQIQSTDRDVTVSVADTGPGIAAEDLPSVFEEFHQLDPVGSHRHNGLGLAICKRFVELHGGNIWVQPSTSNGTTFCFSLPRTDNIAALPYEPDWAMLANAVRSEPRVPTIAVVGTDPEGLRVFRRYLDGYQVLPVEDGEQLSRLASDRSIQAVVVASADPAYWNNWLVGHGVPAEHEYLRNVPMIRCPLRTVGGIASDMGAADYLRKPVTREQIRASLNRLGRPIRRVVVAEDDHDMARLLAFMVRAEFPRCRAIQAKNGREAMAVLQDQSPDAILLDLLMPDGDGYAVLERMQGDERLRRVPVVIVSARANEIETVAADRLEIGRPGGLSVGEVMVCLQRSLDWLLHPQPKGADQAPPATPAA